MFLIFRCSTCKSAASRALGLDSLCLCVPETWPLVICQDDVVDGLVKDILDYFRVWMLRHQKMYVAGGVVEPTRKI